MNNLFQRIIKPLVYESVSSESANCTLEHVHESTWRLPKTLYTMTSLVLVLDGAQQRYTLNLKGYSGTELAIIGADHLHQCINDAASVGLEWYQSQKTAKGYKKPIEKIDKKFKPDTFIFVTELAPVVRIQGLRESHLELLYLHSVQLHREIRAIKIIAEFTKFQKPVGFEHFYGYFSLLGEFDETSARSIFGISPRCIPLCYPRVKSCGICAKCIGLKKSFDESKETFYKYFNIEEAEFHGIYTIVENFTIRPSCKRVLVKYDVTGNVDIKVIGSVDLLYILGVVDVNLWIQGRVGTVICRNLHSVTGKVKHVISDIHWDLKSYKSVIQRAKLRPISETSAPIIERITFCDNGDSRKIDNRDE